MGVLFFQGMTQSGLAVRSMFDVLADRKLSLFRSSFIGNFLATHLISAFRDLIRGSVFISARVMRREYMNFLQNNCRSSRLEREKLDYQFSCLLCLYTFFEDNSINTWIHVWSQGLFLLISWWVTFKVILPLAHFLIIRHLFHLNRKWWRFSPSCM